MQAEQYAEMRYHLAEQQDELIKQWFNALTESGHAALADATARQVLTDVLEQLIDILWSETIDPVAARSIGMTLARLSKHRVEVVTTTLELLTHYLLDVMPAAHHLHLSRLLAAVTTGLIEQMQSQPLRRNEQGSLEQMSETARLIALYRARERYCRAIVSSVPLILLVIDRSGLITVAEGKALRRLNFACADIIGQSIFDVADKQPDLLEHTIHALTGEAFITVIESGETILEIRYEPHTDADGMLIGTIAVAYDVTLRTKREIELLRMRRRVAEETATYRQHMAQVLETKVIKQLQSLQARVDQMYADHDPAVPQGTAATKQVSAHLDQVYQSVLTLSSSLRDQQTITPVPTLDVQLTREEQAALELLAAGHSNREMAVALKISTKAVEKRLSKLYAKLGVMTRAEAIVLGIRTGLV